MSQHLENIGNPSKVVEPVKEFLTGLVAPEDRGKINIISDHITVLHGSKTKKQLSRKMTAKKSALLTRREASKLGLFALPTKSLKYVDVLPLHDLWKGYIREHLSLWGDETAPDVSDPRYDAFSKLLVKADLHGAIITVARSKCPSFIGISGIVVLDTKNTLKVVGEDNRLRTLPKQDCIFTISLGTLLFTLFGKHLAIRPAERSVKKIKNFIEPDL